MIETNKRTYNKILCSIILSAEEDSDGIRKTIASMKKICSDSEYIVVGSKDSMTDALNSVASAYVNIISAGSEYVKVGSSDISEILRSGSENILVANVGEKCGKEYPLRKSFAEDSGKLWTRFETAFIRTGFLKKNIVDYSDDNFVEAAMFLTKLVERNGGYASLETVEIDTVQPLEYTTHNKTEMRNSEWYAELFSHIEKLITELGNTSYVQTVYSYLIKMAIWENMNSRNKGCLFGEDVQDFFRNCTRYISMAEDSVIAGLPGTAHLNYYLATLKNGSGCGSVAYRNNDIEVVCNDATYLKASELTAYVPLMEYKNGKLIIEALFAFPKELEREYSFYAQYGKDIIPFKKGSAYAQYKAFGEIIYCWNPIAVEIPIKNKGTISFYCENDNGSSEIKGLFFPSSLGKLRWKNSYWVCENRIITYRDKKIHISEKTAGSIIKREALFVIGLLRKTEPGKWKALFTRIAYFLSRPFFKKDIWLFEDKVFKAGDNGEYLYDYCRKQHDGIKKYYILSRNCIDAKRFSSEGKKYVAFGSLKHRLLLLNSNIVFATHKDSARRHGFDNLINFAFRDKFNFSSVCIQHGLSVQYIPNLVNRINDNLKGFFLASPIERENVMGEDYGYRGHENMLKITGCPRYDGLVNNDKKQILITPTWRNYLSVLQGKADEVRGYNEAFKDSQYFRLYNNLINDKKLIECARETGYKIVYLLHPATSSQIGDFDTNDYVQLLTATGNMSYEKVLTESSLMVTDYSGVQFDFAYMYKPIVYFQPDELPPSYDAGYYDYNTMALGDITKTVDETVEMICEYMKNECEIKPEYRKRVDDFFLYHDHNNCKRVYDEIMEMREKGEV